jgi:general secretion pathway protein D
MNSTPSPTFRAILRGFAPLVIVLFFTGQVFSQGTRPGSTARGSSTGTRAGTATRGATTGGTSGTRGSSGQRQYRSNTELGDAVIQIDPETRSLVIVTDEETHNELAKVIANLDKPKPQVLIKVVFLEIAYNKGLDVGVEGAYTFNLKNPIAATTGSSVATSTTTNNNTGTTNTNATGTGTSFTGVNTTTGNTSVTSTLTTPLGSPANIGETAAVQSLYGLANLSTGNFVRLVSNDWSATLRLLATKGKLEVLSRPSIMARNNQEAVIVVGSEVPFITNSRITDNGDTINTITYDNVGIILRVTPFITTEGTIEMIVAPEISTLTDQTVPISSNVSAPVIAKRSAETVVVTPNGQTVVIGGLMETQKTESVQKFPILGDIPFIGAAFRRTIKADQKRELLIFLTPMIVNDAAGIARTTTGEIDKAEYLNSGISNNLLMKYLDDLPLPSDKDQEEQGTAVKAKRAKTAPPTPAPKRAKATPTPKPVPVTRAQNVTPVKATASRTSTQ